MPGSKSKNLSALLRSATKLSKQWKPVSPSTSAQDIALKHYVSPNDSSKSLTCGDFDSYLSDSEASSKQCACKLGVDTTIKMFRKLGRETARKEYNALIRLCMEKARESNDEEVSLKQLSMAYQLLKSMKEQGFQVEEESYHLHSNIHHHCTKFKSGNDEHQGEWYCGQRDLP